MYILTCPKCGKMFKCVYATYIGEKYTYITDFNDTISDTCIKCGQKINPQVMQTEDYIANAVFTVKGEI